MGDQAMQLRWTDGGAPPQRARCPGCFSEKGLTTVCPHCGFDEADDNPVGTLPSLTSLQQGRYKTGRVLGQPDWFGVTYLGLDEKQHVRVAIREYFPSDRAALRSQATAAASGQEDAFMKGLEAFRQQAEFLSRFRHPHIQQVRAFFLENGLAYRVTDFPGGIRLSRHLEQCGGRLNPRGAMRLLQPVFEGLDEVHQAGLLHGGLEPGKIRLIRQQEDGSPNHPLLIGFAAERSAYIESRESAAKPSAYDAPEVALGSPPDRLAEVYSAAAIIYRLVGGQAPLMATDRIQQDRESADPLIRPSRLSQEILGPFEEALLKGLALQRERRPQDLREMLRTLRGQAGQFEAACGAEPSHQPEQPKPPLEESKTEGAQVISYPTRRQAPRRKRPIPAGLLAVALVGLVAVLALVLSIGIPARSPLGNPEAAGARRPDLDQPLVKAVQQDDSGRVGKLIEQGADPDARDAAGTPVLVIAARRGRPDIVEALLQAGAQVNARGPHGETALRSAVLINSTQAVRLLASKGPDDRVEALKLAQELGRPEIVRLLQDRESGNR